MEHRPRERRVKLSHMPAKLLRVPKNADKSVCLIFCFVLVSLPEIWWYFYCGRSAKNKNNIFLLSLELPRIILLCDPEGKTHWQGRPARGLPRTYLNILPVPLLLEFSFANG